jgi:hypothetical protein
VGGVRCLHPDRAHPAGWVGQQPAEQAELAAARFRLRLAGRAELPIQALGLRLDRVARHAELTPDLLRRETAGQEVEDGLLGPGHLLSDGHACGLELSHKTDAALDPLDQAWYHGALIGSLVKQHVRLDDQLTCRAPAAEFAARIGEHHERISQSITPTPRRPRATARAAQPPCRATSGRGATASRRRRAQSPSNRGITALPRCNRPRGIRAA